MSGSMNIDYLSLIQPLISIDLITGDIEYSDIVYALNDTNINKQTYNTLYNCMIHCLKELWLIHYSKSDELTEKFKEFIIINKDLLTIYSQAELNNVMYVLKRTSVRYNNGETFQDDEMLNEEIECNIYGIREMITTSNFIFNMCNIRWLNSDVFISNMDDIISSTNEKWIKLHEAFREFIYLI